MNLPQLQLPESLNYIGLFLTLECNLNCSYCINDPQQAGRRASIFPIQSAEIRAMSPELWARGLARVPYSPELPITLQGGEPMLYWKGQGLGLLLEQLPHYFDLLTNFAMQPETFARNLRGQQKKLQRDAPYPSIRVSYHAEEMNRAWKGRGFAELVERCAALADLGFRVSPNKAESDVGIYMVAHPENRVTAEMEAIYRNRVPFETKEFLGVDGHELYGHYLYPFSTDLIARGFAEQTLTCECRTTELLLDPLGFVWGCHFYLYQNWERGGPKQQFAALAEREFAFTECADRLFAGDEFAPIGHLLDPAFSMAALTEYRPCRHYGRCIGCDTKIKNDRFQSYYDQGIPHTSVQMRNIRLPEELLRQADNRQQIIPFLHPDCRPTP
ncbi:MAG: hypothetical protein ACM3X0_04650 [Bacteroidota bacterium]